MLDPVFVGYAAANKYQAVMKTVEREAENEPVGLVVQKNGVTEVVEYSELPDEIRKAREPSKEEAGWFYSPKPGPLIFRQAQILVFLLDTQFLLRMVKEQHTNQASLYHKATKAIEYFDLGLKQVILPKQTNGYKFELFFHSFLPHVSFGKLGVFQVDRETEFSPIKDRNGTSAYTPETARAQLLREATMWLKAVPNIKMSASAIDNVEVSFLLSYRGESLINEDIAMNLAQQHIDGPGYITHLGDFVRKP